jgi:hypothetical protein
MHKFGVLILLLCNGESSCSLTVRRFIAYMDRFLPNWRLLRDELNRAPLSHVD